MTAISSAKSHRERLFRKSRSFLRPLDIAQDFWVLWAAYDLDQTLISQGHAPVSFPNMKQGMKKDEFLTVLKIFAAAKSQILLIEDDTKSFKAKRGPIGMVSLDNYGWRLEPWFDFFYWATKRMKLRAVVSFLHMISHSRQFGVCVVRVGERDVNFCDHLVKKYELLRPAGRISHGRPDGAEFIYSTKCKGASKARAAVPTLRDERAAA